MKTLNLKKTTKLLSVMVMLCISFYNPLTSFAQQKAKQSNVKPPKQDIHTTIITDNMVALKQHIEAGSDLNIKEGMGGSSPLITATLFGKTAMAKALIDAGANINLQNNDGSTALHVASFFCRPAIVKMLLAKGANRGIKNKYGSTAYESLLVPFKDVKGVYDMMGKMLAPMGLKLDYTYIEATRPKIAAIIK